MPRPITNGEKVSTSEERIAGLDARVNVQKAEIKSLNDQNAALQEVIRSFQGKLMLADFAKAAMQGLLANRSTCGMSCSKLGNKSVEYAVSLMHELTIWKAQKDKP